MRLAQLPGAPELTYCTNIHAGESWDEIRASLDAHVPRIKAQVAPDAPFGLGLRLSGVAAAELVGAGTARCLQGPARAAPGLCLHPQCLPVRPLPRHAGEGARLSSPTGARGERVSFTRDAADILAALLPAGGFGSISTVPGGFKPVGREPKAVAALVDHLLQAAAHLVVIERRTGKRIALALEPEPCCFLETVEETLAFFEDALLRPAALARFAELAGLGGREAEPMLRRHLGVCYDVCHGAVEYEDPVAALRRLRGAGIAIPKIQLSAAMRVPASLGRARGEAPRLRHRRLSAPGDRARRAAHALHRSSRRLYGSG